MVPPDNGGTLRQLLARQKELERLIDSLRNGAENDETKTRTPENIDLIDSVGNEVTGELLLVRAALQRLKDGSFGTCNRCSASISNERLQRYAYALLCASCAREAGGESGEACEAV